MPTARTPQEVFQHHAEALIAGDIDGIVADYSEDAIFITPAGVKRGKEGSARRSRSSSGSCPTPHGT